MQIKIMEKSNLKQGFQEMEKDGLISPMVKGLVENRSYLGHSSSRSNPKMKQFIVGSKGNLEIINLDKTAEFLSKAVDEVKKLGGEGKSIFFVGSDPIIRDLVEKMAIKAESPYVIGRWLGGLLTNFKILSSRLKQFLDLRDREQKGELKKYTKKEQGQFRKKIEKLSRLFYGLENYKRLPDAIILVNINLHETAIAEAKIMNIPVIAIVDTDSNPEKVDYPIPASDQVRSSVEFILNKLVDGYNEGRNALKK